jgi:hypothetical protein
VLPWQLYFRYFIFGKYNGFVSKARVSACMYFLVYRYIRSCYSIVIGRVQAKKTVNKNETKLTVQLLPVVLSIDFEANQCSFVSVHVINNNGFSWIAWGALGTWVFLVDCKNLPSLKKTKNYAAIPRQCTYMAPSQQQAFRSFLQ